MGITNLGKQEAEKAQERQQDMEEYAPYDVEGDAWGRSHPTTAVAGTAVALRKWEPQDGDVYGGLVLEDPYVITDDADTEGTTIVESSEDSGDDFKVVNEDDEATELLENVGVDFDGSLFKGEPTDDFDLDDDQNLVLKVGGSTMRQVLRRLDVSGDQAAGVQTDEDGEYVLSDNGYPIQNEGLIEYNDDSDEFEYNIARNPEIRPDVEGEEVAVMIQRKKDVYDDYDGRAYFTTVLVENDDGEFESVEPTDEYSPDIGNIIDSGWLEWSYPDTDNFGDSAEGTGDSGNQSSPTTSESSGLTASEISAIDKIETALEKGDADLGSMSREEVQGVVSDNADEFETDTDMETVVDELLSRA